MESQCIGKVSLPKRRNRDLQHGDSCQFHNAADELQAQRTPGAGPYTRHPPLLRIEDASSEPESGQETPPE